MTQNKQTYKPLLYIAQPEMRDPTGEMQQMYASELVNSGKQKYNKSDQSSHISLNIPNYTEVATESNDLEQSVKNVDLNKKETMTHDDAFRHLSVVDQITYLLNLPQYMPSLICQIDTDDEQYVGRVVKFEKPYVFIRLQKRRQTDKIHLDKIENIRITSF